jgi:hypothetical protein
MAGMSCGVHQFDREAFVIFDLSGSYQVKEGRALG